MIASPFVWPRPKYFARTSLPPRNTDVSSENVTRGRPIGVPGAASGSDRIALNGADGGDISAQSGECLEGITGDDLTDFHESGRVEVAQPDDIEQGLTLPGLGYRTAVLEAIARHRAGPNGMAAATAQKPGGEQHGEVVSFV